METKFKTGDKVLLNKPKCPNNNILFWGVEMERYIGDVLVLPSVVSPLTREERPTEQVIKPIDWEQRRWELVCRILAQESMSIADGIEYADAIIKQYKQTLK